MSDNTERHLKQTKEYLEGSLKEYFDTLRTMKGETFCEIVRYLSGVSHAAKLISVGTRDCPPHIRNAVGMQFAAVSAGGATLLMKLANVSDEDQAEMLKWSETISDTVDHGIEQLMKNLKGDQDES